MSEKILEKIKKLFAQAEGEKSVGNAEAAQTFLEKIQEPLDKHNLSMSAVEIEAERRAEIGMETVSPILRQNYDAWQLGLLEAVSKRNGCIPLDGRHFLGVVGREADRKIVVEMYRYFEKLALELAEKALTEHNVRRQIEELLIPRPYGAMLFGFTQQTQRSIFDTQEDQDADFRRSFLTGFAYSLVVRFKSFESENEKNEEVPANSQALVFKSEKLTDANKWIEKNLDCGGGRDFEPCFDTDAANMGMKLGEQIALTNKTLE